jgi:hypothetical protein
MKELKTTKWLLRKASGSRARYKVKGRYSGDKLCTPDVYADLPAHESIKKSRSYLDTSLIKKWLYSKLGCDFDDVYSEYLSRLQPKYREEYRDSIFGYIHRKDSVTIKENGEVWGKHGSSNGSPLKLPYWKDERFYIHPMTNKVCNIPAEQLKR